MVIPVVKALRVFDGKAFAIGLAWKVMHDLETHVLEFVPPPFALSVDLAAKACEPRNRVSLLEIVFLNTF